MELSHLLNLNNLRSTCFGAVATTLLACTSTTTPQLADARKAYQEAADSPAQTRAPGALSEARAALDRAERAHDQNPGSDREAQLAERAQRQAHYAQMRGESRETRADERADVRAEHVAHERREVRDTPKNERHADAALQSLAQVANVKEEPRGYVITLSGSLLFPNGKEDVSPVANRSLDQVADALAKQPSDTKFEVEGYTDNSGSDDQNRTLSEKRAQAVADKLSQAGIDPDRIRVEGRGEADPIADNNTAEGRASNRRVEIIVDRNDHS